MPGPQGTGLDPALPYRWSSQGNGNKDSLLPSALNAAARQDSNLALRRVPKKGTGYCAGCHPRPQGCEARQLWGGAVPPASSSLCCCLACWLSSSKDRSKNSNSVQFIVWCRCSPSTIPVCASTAASDWHTHGLSSPVLPTPQSTAPIRSSG